jgi:hypothetical protein
LEVSEALAKAVAVVQMVRLVRDAALRLIRVGAIRDRSSTRGVRRVHRLRWAADGT